MQANYKKLMNFYRNRIVPTYKEIDEYTDDFKKIYDKFVAPYENKDDEYASKMEKIYDKGKSWLQKAEDWFHNHKDAIGVFFTEFVKGFVVAAVVVVIAGALSISAGVVFTVLMIAVPLGESAVASIPDGAFDGPLLKDFKKNCNETKDSVGKLCSITLDRGPMGFVECIGQGMEDAVQTDKGIAATFGSVSGMTLGAFAGGKFVESFSTPEVTVSESEIAELEKPKVKEVKPKDVEGEKPKVSKVEEKPIGPQAKLEKVKFKEGRYEHHMSHVEKFTDQGGASGGHNLNNFKEGIANSKYTLDHYEVSKHSDIDGVYEIEYTLKRPVKDYTGKPIPGEFKHVPGGKRIFKKTVYDPNVISDNEMIKLSKDAMKEAVKENRFVSRPNQNKRLLQGQVSYKGKILKFEGFKNMNTGEIENAYPVLEWSAQNE
ncbi:CdiA family toxin C-terminal domain-containing protein [Lachnobacterium bovis]|uniref:CdiA family toxin C-terminal domain-containing protein n=1 Tax=Lachnobacterium bovis TaxID=140626 RepID=UPI000689B5E0|nr:CdiA family toxin C-terminal domain-containing protein [Lachnobacterium bovis]